MTLDLLPGVLLEMNSGTANEISGRVRGKEIVSTCCWCSEGSSRSHTRSPTDSGARYGVPGSIQADVVRALRPWRDYSFVRDGAHDDEREIGSFQKHRVVVYWHRRHVAIASRSHDDHIVVEELGDVSSELDNEARVVVQHYAIGQRAHSKGDDDD